MLQVHLDGDVGQPPEPDQVGDLLAQRQEARARRDFAVADTVRDRLTAAGVSVEDSPDGPTWSLKDM